MMIRDGEFAAFRPSEWQENGILRPVAVHRRREAGRRNRPWPAVLAASMLAVSATSFAAPASATAATFETRTTVASRGERTADNATDTVHFVPAGHWRNYVDFVKAVPERPALDDGEEFPDPDPPF